MLSVPDMDAHFIQNKMYSPFQSLQASHGLQNSTPPPCPPPTTYHLPSPSLCPSPPHPLHASQMIRAPCGLRAFALTVTSGWNALSPLSTLLVPSLHSGLCLKLTLSLRAEGTHLATCPCTLFGFLSISFHWITQYTPTY